MKSLLLVSILIFYGLIIPALSFAQLSGKVVGIADGDTFTMLVDKQQVKVRLHGIDCPEKGQDYYQVAKDYLANLIFNKQVTVKKIKTDKYRRTVGIVTMEGVNVNEKILAAGLAWHAPAYDNNPRWKELAKTACKNKVGLWKSVNPIPPWEFRKKKK